MPPCFQQTYEETFEIEKENLKRDIDILNQVSNNKFIFLDKKHRAAAAPGTSLGYLR